MKEDSYNLTIPIEICNIVTVMSVKSLDLISTSDKM